MDDSFALAITSLLYTAARETPELPGAAGKLSNSFYGDVQVSHSCNILPSENLRDMGFEQSVTNPCVICQTTGGELEVLQGVDEDDIFVASQHKMT